MKKMVAALAVAAIATFSAGSAAQAAVIDFAVISTGTVTYAGTNLGDSTALDLGAATLAVSSVGADDTASGLAIGDPVGLSPLVIAYGAGAGPHTVDIVKTWTGTTGTFIETLTSASIFRFPGAPNFITVELTGMVTGPAGSGFLDTPAEMLLSATQVRGPGGAVSVSLTNTAETSAIPEPSTWVMMGLGFVGLGYAAVRRGSKDRTALAI
jgi:hypothetical protein